MKKLKQTVIATLMLIFIFTVNSCKKEEQTNVETEQLQQTTELRKANDVAYANEILEKLRKLKIDYNNTSQEANFPSFEEKYGNLTQANIVYYDIDEQINFAFPLIKEDEIKSFIVFNSENEPFIIENADGITEEECGETKICHNIFNLFDLTDELLDINENFAAIENVLSENYEIIQEENTIILKEQKEIGTVFITNTSNSNIKIFCNGLLDDAVSSFSSIFNIGVQNQSYVQQAIALALGFGDCLRWPTKCNFISSLNLTSILESAIQPVNAFHVNNIYNLASNVDASLIENELLKDLIELKCGNNFDNYISACDTHMYDLFGEEDSKEFANILYNFVVYMKRRLHLPLLQKSDASMSTTCASSSTKAFAQVYTNAPDWTPYPISLCDPQYFSPNSVDFERMQWLLHEYTHALIGTTDYFYDQNPQIYSLDAMQALGNADSWTSFILLICQ